MACFKIVSVTFNPTPAGNIDVTFSYTPTLLSLQVPIVIGTVSVPNTGILTTPLEVCDLDPDTEYTIYGQTTCGTIVFETTITTASSICPSITGIQTTIN